MQHGHIHMTSTKMETGVSMNFLDAEEMEGSIRIKTPLLSPVYFLLFAEH